MSSFAAVRPGTPFPSTESLSHTGDYMSYPSSSPSASASASSSRLSPIVSPVMPTRPRYSRSFPLHFTLPAIPARTPPSLLKRSASSSSSTSASGSDETSTSTSNNSRKIARPSLPSPIPSMSPAFSRRESESSSSSSSGNASPPMPSTPPTIAVHPAPTASTRQPRPKFDPHAFPELDDFTLGAAAATPSLLSPGAGQVIELLSDEAYDLARAQAQAFYKRPSTPPSTPAPAPAPAQWLRLAAPASAPAPAAIKAAPAPTPTSASPRPKFKRRDTPRPIETFTTLALASLGSWYDYVPASFAPTKLPEMVEEEDERERERERRVQAKRYTSMIDGGEWTVMA